MINMNRAEIIGNLTKDPEIRYTPNNQAVVSFSVATNRRYRDTAGAWVDAPPDYHDVVVWGQLGERCQQVLHRGDKVFLSGRSQTRSWEAPDGTKKYRTELVADTVLGPDQVNKNMTGSSEGGEYGGGASSAPAAPRRSSAPSAPTGGGQSNANEINIDDIPF